jgi:hypothetical protein
MISKYKGVSWDKRTKKWESVLTSNGLRYPCGFYDDEISAVKARDRKIMALGLDYKKLQIFSPLKK